MAGRRILLGHITGAHGIRGDVLIKSYAATPEGIAAYGPLGDEAGARQFELLSVRETGKGVVARIKGVGDRTAAEALKGTRLYVDRERLPEPEDGAFYRSDLIGMAALSTGSALLGEVIGVENYGAGDLLEIRLSSSKKSVLIPFSVTFVPEVDFKGRRVTVILPDSSEGDTE